VLRPLNEFLSTSTAGGVLLLAAAGLALAWANSPWRAAYERLWGTTFSLGVGPWGIEKDLRYWTNEGLMALFFLVAGLEIKRELLTGELRDRRAALLPAVAALGGMIVPALIYLALSAGGRGARGWGISTPTDIAFALGLLALAAGRAPASLKPFLLTLAIVDDLATIVVVALFYSAEVAWMPLGIALLIVLAVVGLQRIHVRAPIAYVGLGVALWLAVQRSGVHPAIAGAFVGALTPAVAFQRPRTVSEEAHRIADETVDDPFPPDADAHHWLRLATLSREAVSPLARIEHVLLPWVSFVLLPVFAFANAGVTLLPGSLGPAAGNRIAIGIVVGRLIGKVAGITIASWLAVRAGLARLPRGANWLHVAGTAAAAGVAFTVSLFVADLAFPTGSPAEVSAKVGILATAPLAGGLAMALFRSAERRSG
jgi:NhaA family Na+:H+ antiporter